MSEYSHLSDEELKQRIAAGEKFLRSHMSEEEYENFMQEIERNKVVLNPIYTEPKKRFSLEDALICPPTLVVILCYILKPILLYGGFVFMLCGGLLSLIMAYGIIKSCITFGWHGILTINTVYILAYLVIMFIIDKLRYIVYLVVG